LLKRLSGGEFCSDAHRKEYQQEYTNLALSRLQEVMTQGPPAPPALPIIPPQMEVPGKTADAGPPAEPAKPVITPPSRAPSAAAGQPVPPQALPVMQETPTPKTQGPPRTPAAAVPPAQPKRTPPVVPRPQSKAAVPPKREGDAPAMAGTRTRKPAAANIRTGIMMAALETAPSTIAPHLPFRSLPVVSTGFATASPVAWAPLCEFRESAAPVMESRLEVRSFVRAAPVLDPVLDVELNVIAPQGWDLTQRVAGPAVPLPAAEAVAPREPRLWQAPPCAFTRSVIALGEWAALPFSAIESSEQPSTIAPVGEPEGLSEDRNPGSEPVPLAVEALPAGKARPVQVFTAYLASGFRGHIPQSEAVPLRPTMILGPAIHAAGVTAPPAEERSRKPDVRILAPEKPIVAPSVPPVPSTQEQEAQSKPVSLEQPVPQADFGRPRGRLGSSKILTLFGGSNKA
jgi:hypothetical protein